MSNILSKIQQKIATKSLNHHDLSCNHVTSSDFFNMRPVYIHEMMPKEKINIDMSTFSRLDPLFKPVFGNAKFVNRAFFVPCRTIMKNWNAFITESIVNEGNSPFIPRENAFFTSYAWYSFLCQKVMPTDTSEDPLLKYVTYSSEEPTSYDFYIPTQTTAFRAGYYTYNARGRRIMTIMHSLGYSIDTSFIDASDSNGFHYSALPLLAFFKIWIDWFASTQYVQSTSFATLFDNNGTNIHTNGLNIVFDRIFAVEYEKDYFTSAWDNPVSPVTAGTSSSNLSINDVTVSENRFSGVTATRDPNGTPIVTSYSPGAQVFPQNMSQYIIDALKAATDYIKRKQLAGIRSMDRYLAQWGITLSDEKLNRSVYLGKHDVNIEIADVMNTTAYSDPNDPALGDYSGKGISFGNGHFSFKTDEFGYLIIVSTLLPHIGYYDGIFRNNLHTKPLDYFMPEFDRLGVQAIGANEIKTILTKPETDTSSGESLTPFDVFGFTSRYAEYKTGRDFMSGNMRLFPNQYDTYHFMRRITMDEREISLDFLTSNQNQFNRVFADTDNNFDHLQTIYRFKVDSYSPASKLFDDYEFDGGNSVQMNLNGTRFD